MIIHPVSRDAEALRSGACRLGVIRAPLRKASASRLTILTFDLILNYSPRMNDASLAACVRHLWKSILFPAVADAATSIQLRSLILLIILPALLLYPTLGFHLLEPDEGRYAQIPREMLQNGEWVVPTLQGEPYLDKPPLMYWLIKISYRLFGVSESAARLVPAVCVHLTIIAVYLIGRRSLGEHSALWAALLLTVAPGFIGIARLLLLDGLLTLFVTLSVLSGYEAVRLGSLKLNWWIASAICSGLGFLTKGPISEILLFPPLVAIAWLTGSMARVGWKNVLMFFVIVISINVPWYIAIYLREPLFLKHFFWEHNVMRFVQPFDHLQPVWYYAPVLLLGFLPGTLLFLPFLRQLLNGTGEYRSQAGGFWLLAGLWCVAFFSISGSKLPTYILPAYPFLCLALGEFIARSDWRMRIMPKAMVAAFALLLAGLFHFGLPWYARERSPFGDPGLVERFLGNDVVVTYPRNCDSLAYYVNRSDFQHVRSKDVNDLMVAMHHRPRTVILFSHRHAFEAFRDALPPSLEVEENVSLKRSTHSFLDKLVGDTPWGLAEIAVIRPAGTARAQKE